MKVSGDVLFRNHVHTFRLLFTNHTYRAQQMTKIIDQVRIQQLDRKTSFNWHFYKGTQLTWLSCSCFSFEGNKEIQNVL